MSLEHIKNSIHRHSDPFHTKKKTNYMQENFDFVMRELLFQKECTNLLQVILLEDGIELARKLHLKYIFSDNYTFV